MKATREEQDVFLTSKVDSQAREIVVSIKEEKSIREENQKQSLELLRETI